MTLLRAFRGWPALVAGLVMVAACAAPAAPAPTAAPPTAAPAAKPTAASSAPTAAPAGNGPASAAAFDEDGEAKKLYDATAAAGETEVNLYTSINEREAGPYVEAFQKLYPNVKVNVFRSDETALTTRILTEAQANKPNFDVLVTTAAHVLGPAGLALKWTPPNAARLDPQYVDKDGLYFGVYANYNVIQINTNKVKKDAIKSYQDLTRPEFKDQMILDDTDYAWLAGLYETLGKQQATDVLSKIAANGVTIVNGHAAIADKVVAGEYAVAVNNYLNLVERAKRDKAPTEWIAVEPVVVDYSKVLVDKSAPHPNAAKLLANYTLSTTGQSLLAKNGRVPTRTDVPADPPDLTKNIKKYAATPLLGPALDGLAADFKQIFKS